ncbi:BTAD domain-containing putative transcriptional regulator [Streptomyces sp. NPDC046831]|uniref:BTAD domain-containing putative transcriptional regulator n=1 Tax=Streptomyces sp. NPDC046831 TaxID=3154805 RepID=UPI0033E8A281
MRCELRFGLLGPPALYEPPGADEPAGPVVAAGGGAAAHQKGPAGRDGVAGREGAAGPPVARPIGSPKVRALLAALLLEAGRVVSVESLQEALWDGAPPASARASLHNHVARLRRLLDDPQRLRAVPPGYVLRVRRGELDVHVFEARLAEARLAHADQDWVRVLRACAAALKLWRGTPLGGLPAGLGRYSVVQRLEEARLLLLEWRYDAELAVGGTRPAGLVPELTALAAEHPMREAYHRQLMIALHRTGRRAEALAVHRDLRARMVDELGVEPGAAVREAHLEVLRGVVAQAEDSSAPAVGRAPDTSPTRDTRPTPGARPAPGAGPVPEADAASAADRAARVGAAPAAGRVSGAGTASAAGSSAAAGTAPVAGSSAAAGTAPVAGTSAAHGTAPVAGSSAAAGTAPAADSSTEADTARAAGSSAALGCGPESASEPVTDSAAQAGPAPAPASETVSGPVVANAGPLRSTQGDAAPSPRPAQLPPPPAHFTGRDDVQQALRLYLTAEDGFGDVGGSPVAVLSGMAGVGKSALALHVAHGLLERFPDGQLYLNLHGATPGMTPLTPGQALRALLRDLGTGPRHIPDHPGAAAALLRSLLAPTRTLLLLDDAESAAQVRPLLPAGGGCAVIVTSRSPLTALDAARRFALAPLSGEDSAALLRAVSGRDGLHAGHPLVELTGRLPLALRVVAARLAARQALTPDVLAGQLAATEGRLHHLEYDDLSVRRSLAVAHDALAASEREADRDAALTLRHIGALDLPTYGARLLARLTGTDEPRAEAALDRLVDVALLEETAYGRYAPHDLVRDFARELTETPTATGAPTSTGEATFTGENTFTGGATAAGTGTGTVMDTVTARGADPVEAALRWYAAVAQHALTAVAEPGLDREDRCRPTAAQPPEHAADLRSVSPFCCPEDALAWADAELENVVALAERHAGALGPPYAEAFPPGSGGAGAVPRSAAVADAAPSTPVDAAASAHNDRSGPERLGSDPRQACCPAPAAQRDRPSDTRPGPPSGTRPGQSRGVQPSRSSTVRHGTALSAPHTHAAAPATSPPPTGAVAADDRRAARVSLLVRLFFPYAQRSGRVAEMEVLGRAGLVTARTLGDTAAEAHALGDLAALHYLTGRHSDALALNDRSLELWRRLGVVSRIRGCLDHRGLLLEGLGRYAESGEALRQSLAYSRRLNDPHGEAVTHSHLGTLYGHTDPRAAIEQHRHSLAIGDQIGAVTLRHTAHCNIGHAHLSLGEPEAAAAHFEESLRILGGHGDWQGESRTRLGLVRALRRLGHARRAQRECAELLRRADARADRYAGSLARHQRGLLLRDQGRIEEAHEEWRSALTALDGTDAKAVVEELRELLAGAAGAP